MATLVTGGSGVIGAESGLEVLEHRFSQRDGLVDLFREIICACQADRRVEPLRVQRGELCIRLHACK